MTKRAVESPGREIENSTDAVCKSNAGLRLRLATASIAIITKESNIYSSKNRKK